jgi:hypothetical protein
VMFLHEMAHKMNVIVPDGGNSALSNVNTQIIMYRCGSVLSQ